MPFLGSVPVEKEAWFIFTRRDTPARNTRVNLVMHAGQFQHRILNVVEPRVLGTELESGGSSGAACFLALLGE